MKLSKSQLQEKKYAIIHADDAGLSISHNQATQEGLLNGSISSCSLMVPCPWFYEMAQFCLQHPQLDYGIHLTLTGEWKHYPFRPIRPQTEVASLVDEMGFFYPKRQAILDNAKPDEVYLELKSQIDLAYALGLQPTHLDSHMYTLGIRQDLIEIYRQLGKEYGLPIHLSKTIINQNGMDAKQFKIDDKECVENTFMGSFEIFKGQGLSAYYDDVLDNLTQGLSILLIHPALKSEEMKAIAIDHPNFGAEWRTEDAHYFNSSHCAQKIKENNIQLIGWKDVAIF